MGYSIIEKERRGSTAIKDTKQCKSYCHIPTNNGAIPPCIGRYCDTIDSFTPAHLSPGALGNPGPAGPRLPSRSYPPNVPPYSNDGGGLGL